MQKTMGVVQL